MHAPLSIAVRPSWRFHRNAYVEREWGLDKGWYGVRLSWLQLKHMKPGWLKSRFLWIDDRPICEGGWMLIVQEAL
jgi:hypothetical protein